MRRTFVCVNAVVFVAACGMASVLASHARAQEQLLDPGWQLASSDSPNGNGGFFGFSSGDQPRAGQRPATAPSQRVQTRFVPQSRVQSQYYVPAQQYRAYRRSAPAYGAAQGIDYRPTGSMYGVTAAPDPYQPRYVQPRGLFEGLFASHDPAPPPAAYAPAYGARVADPAHPAVDPIYDRQVVDYPGSEKPGTIIIDSPHFFLYLVMADGKALRYGIGVGRPGFAWSGVKQISAMREWPDWTPPAEMLERRPDLPRFMPGGPDNPLGARAMYLGSTLYRIHGSNEPWTIGTQVSSGCIRLRNEDVTDLYGRVKVGTKVIVL
ncbi:MAG TPA: L,D-transpeptidase [Xanthobacteraceae bacterium]|jgi:lipoprotein-anchoring transpeptidase ErfK/SrfK